MSLSNSQPSKRFSGRVVLSVESPGPDEMTIQELEGKKNPVWDETTDREFLDRVREKAQAMAKDILTKAMKEAEAIQARAREQGLDQGLAQAAEQTEKRMNELGASLAAVMESLKSQGGTVWKARQQDIIALIRMAVDKALRVEMSERRREILEGLLNEALERIESRRRFTVKVAPADQEAVEELLRAAQKENHGVSQWEVKADPGLEPGGVVLETSDGKVDNSLASRLSEVEPILDQLTLNPEE